MRCLPVVLAALAACASVRPAPAADPAPLDLPALLEEVERASPQILAMRARAEAAATAAPAREALPDPTLSASYTNDGLSGFTLGSSEFANLTVGWEQEVPAKAVRNGAAGVARAQSAALSAVAATGRLNVRARVIALYAELWRLDRTKALLVESRELMATAAEAAQARYESGEGIQEGLIRAQTVVRRADLDLIELALLRRQAEIALSAVLGRTDDPSFGPAGSLPEVAGAIDSEGVVATAIASSPEVAETSARQRAAEAELADARVQVKSTFSWLLAYQFRGGLDPMVMGGFSVKLPVWKDRKQERAIASAEIGRTAASLDRAEAELKTRAQARGLVAEVDSIEARLRLYREAIVPQSVAAFESANAALASGRAEMFLVLDDLDRWTRARKEAVALEAQRVATIASLEAVTGTTLLDMSASGRSQ